MSGADLYLQLMSKPRAGFPEINLEDFEYDLPKDRIAQYPLERRDESKLLCFNGGKINHYKFKDVPSILPSNSTLFLNDTRVIPARIMFQRKTGASIEIFLLEPVSPGKEMVQAMMAKGECTWKCMVRNLKKWKDDEVLEKVLDQDNLQFKVKARLISRDQMEVQLSWNPSDYTFSEILEELGKIPLPPYVAREVEASDIERYQTIYSSHQGAVAAPTAGLHFTDCVMEELAQNGIRTNYLTLHVSSGTFQPIKTKDISKHPMHSEQIVVTRSNLEVLMDCKFMVAVGTTSMRTIESIYWYGVQLQNGNKFFHIEKDVPYRNLESLTPEKAFNNVLEHMTKHGHDTIVGTTEIFIVPGYEFKTCDAIITNFHIPGSTLMLLIGAFIGDDWREVYREALENNYRFLSYGDSSILFRNSN
jgi:S-adenosylmethionine:tRNA ribosyltransferase-isomerase